jgi:Zn-dependent M28 family amino/carboxypeptidase
VPGANDGASGVAVCLELARMMAAAPPPLGVDIALFDGEDQGRPDHPEEYLIGSKWYVRQAASYRPLAVILLDMVGDRDLSLPREAFSDSLAPALTDLVWQTAARLQLPAFVDSVAGAVVDDHLPFLFNRIAAVDIIDFDYPYWHTLEDTADKVSAASLEQVGQLMRELIYYTPIQAYRDASRTLPPPG